MSTAFLKMDFSRSQPVMYSENVAISHKTVQDSHWYYTPLIASYVWSIK